ncbi:MAG: hypothetical protein M3438_07190 [Pseudomonadota bacterium]|nr:hypothetical protein [Pseudomonadota bacterium]
MPRRTDISSILIIGASALALSACATTARLHSVEEINSVGASCGVELGEVFQDESEKRLLFLMKPGATQAQRLCVGRWARRNHMKFVFVEAINFPES